MSFKRYEMRLAFLYVSCTKHAYQKQLGY